MHHIVNENAKDVIFETIRASTSTLEKDYDHKEYTDTDDVNNVLLGTVLGKSALHMLLDYKAEIWYRSLGPPLEVWIVSLTSCTDSLS